MQNPFFFASLSRATNTKSPKWQRQIINAKFDILFPTTTTTIHTNFLAKVESNCDQISKIPGSWDIYIYNHSSQCFEQSKITCTETCQFFNGFAISGTDDGSLILISPPIPGTGAFN
jgi:hypothetical protein